MTRRQIVYIVLIALVFGAIGSLFMNRYALPLLSTVPGLNWIGKFQSSAPIVITRREEVRLNEGVNLIELTKQAQTVVVSIYHPSTKKILGNGLIITSDGLIFSTKNVVGDNAQVTVAMNDGAVYQGLVRAMDPKSPLVAITIPARDLPVAQFSDAGTMQTAQRVFALGITNQEFTREFVSGLVTKTLNNNIDADRVLDTEVFENTITTDVDLNSDFIGGPLVNLQGLVIGVVTGANGQILPAESIDGALKTYLENGKISRPYIGLKYVMITKNAAKLKGLPNSGALVVATEEGSPAAQSGLLANDTILQVGGRPVSDSSLEQLLTGQGGNEMKLLIVRGSEQKELTLKPELK